MDILYWLFVIACAYFIIVFFILRLVAPFMGFLQYKPPTELPLEIKQTITELESKATDQPAYLQLVYDLVVDKTVNQWGHTRFRAALHLNKLFLEDLGEIWNSKEFVYCQGINFVAFAMLANSSFFTANDVKIRHTFLNFVLHQYLKVKVGEKWVDFDPAGSGIRGGLLGTHASFFG